MPKPQPKKHFQIRRLFGLAKPNASVACMEVGDYLRDLANHVTKQRTSSLAELTFDDANAMIKSLGGDPFPRYGHSRRNENYKKQKAGIKSIETTDHLNFIDELARLRGMTPEGLERLATRMKISWPPRTTEDGNKIVEALKAMNKRDGLMPSTEKQSATAPEPSFRRVA